MPTPLSTKELGGLEDILSIEQNLASKYQTYSGMCQDTDLSNKFATVAGRHQKHFDTLVSYLSS